MNMQIIVRIVGDGELQSESNNIVKLNLDVSTLMAYTSNMTCENCNSTFKQKILNDQAIRERLASR